ncbi:hypothetical protein [Nocardioides caldifontis]|uniref:hypothetical protein n=1 Tax=Nocardioides caldifontis TaxID=2588938 RepID=UPI0011E03720|nr:hypothetical protein [Nocardioides caldifontis]
MFIQIIEGRCRDQERARSLLERWQDEQAPEAGGWLGGTYGFTDDGRLLAVVRFDSRESAERNSGRAEQGAWWSEMEECFDGPVEFHDSDDVTVLLDGGSDGAGFVQVVRGRADDPAKLKELVADAEPLREARPEIIGATLALEPDGTFTQTVAFTDEQSAREGEKERMPEEVRQAMETLIHDVRFDDLHRPWFASRP